MAPPEPDPGQTEVRGPEPQQPARTRTAPSRVAQAVPERAQPEPEPVQMEVPGEPRGLARTSATELAWVLTAVSMVIPAPVQRRQPERTAVRTPARARIPQTALDP